MKIVAIMCIEEYADTARKLLKDVKVPAFSESEMSGFKYMEENEDDNWFASKHILDDSHFFFTMCDEHKAEEIMSAINECKIEINKNHVHAFVLNVEKYIA